MGVEPSQNVAEVARKHGVNTEVSFFAVAHLNKLLMSIKQAPGGNVMCHIPDLNDIAKGVFNLLNDKGVLIFEDPYLGDMLGKFHMIKFMMSMFIYFLQYLFKIFLEDMA